MSKKKINKVNQNEKKALKKRKKRMKSLITTVCVVAILALVIVVVCVIDRITSLRYTDFADTSWKSVSAYDSTNDEVEMSEVYNNYYSNYQGSMNLNGDGTFSFWMSAGNPDDGTHSGTYKYDRENEILNVTFDSGEEVDFKIIRNKDNAITRIEVPYSDYTVYFKPNI